MNGLFEPAPLRLTNNPGQQQLTLVWSETDKEVLSHLLLRRACCCSTCRAKRLKGSIPLLDPDIHITAINNMVYGVQLVFSDGHERGIFPWAYLRQLSRAPGGDGAIN